MHIPARHAPKALELHELGLKLVDLVAQFVDDLLVAGDVEVDADDVADNCSLDVLGAVRIVERVICVLERQ